jgi:hypothetical protein
LINEAAACLQAEGALHEPIVLNDGVDQTLFFAVLGFGFVMRRMTGVKQIVFSSPSLKISARAGGDCQSTARGAW